jgi:hypothetical protein
MGLEPRHILTIGRIAIELCLVAHIEEIHSESELMFTVSRGSTEGVATATEIPESLLVDSTPISTDHRERSSELYTKSGRHIPKSLSCLSPDLYTTPTRLVDQRS